jgi:hypothetical protein
VWSLLICVVEEFEHALRRETRQDLITARLSGVPAILNTPGKAHRDNRVPRFIPAA